MKSLYRFDSRAVVLSELWEWDLHWVQSLGRSAPCAGPSCPLCKFLGREHYCYWLVNPASDQVTPRCLLWEVPKREVEHGIEFIVPGAVISPTSGGSRHSFRLTPGEQFEALPVACVVAQFIDLFRLPVLPGFLDCCDDEAELIRLLQKAIASQLRFMVSIPS